MHRTRSMLVLLLAALAVAGATFAPRAHAWQYVFQDFFDQQNGALGASHAEASKCQGGKLGTYEFSSFAEGRSGDIQVLQRVRAKLPVTKKWRPLTQVELKMEVPDSFDPAITAEILRVYGDFYDGITVRWKPRKLLIRHPEIVLFGTEVLAAGQIKQKFKPKPGC